MAINGLFSRKARSADGEVVRFEPISASDTKGRVELLDSFERSGLGWFWATDRIGRITYLSPTAGEQFGWAEDFAVGKPLTELFVPDKNDQQSGSERPLKFLLSARNSLSKYTVRVADPEREIWWTIAGKPQFDAKGKFLGYRGSAKDVTSTRESRLRAEQLAQFDSLTGLANRHNMESILARTLTAYRNSKRSCALLMLDLDRFKQVNDTLGHPAGDELLRQVAGRLKVVVGEKGTIGRLGGDEFMIMLPDIDDRGTLGELAQRLIQMVSQPYSLNGSRAIIGTSVGIAAAPYDGVDSEELTNATDLALYAAKAGGRGTYRFYSSDLRDEARLHQQIEDDLREAIRKGELSMQYQPIVCAKTHKVTCFEALMRWQHPERGAISPGVFIPVAEEINLIRELGTWALYEVCADAANWPVPLGVAVNVSAIQFAHGDFIKQVSKAIKETRIDPSRLVLEITESVFLGDDGRTETIFRDLKKLGVKLALDDFGTGYSSLRYLQTAPFDKIKIDQSFVRGATESGNNNPAIMSAIIGLAEALDMTTVAEGVEALDELALVKERGASHIQGRIFAMAMTQDDLLERLKRNELEFEPRGPARFRSERRTVFRHIGVIHEDYRYRAMLRNLSKTGAMIEGINEVPVGTHFVLDLDGGQLVVATVVRSMGILQGVEFEIPLISDGANGLCTRHRVSPYEIEAAGRPLAALAEDPYSMLVGEGRTRNIGKKHFEEVDIGKLREKAA